MALRAVVDPDLELTLCDHRDEGSYVTEKNRAEVHGGELWDSDLGGGGGGWTWIMIDNTWIGS